MLILRLIPQHIQMDWSSLDPKDKTDAEEDEKESTVESAAIEKEKESSVESAAIEDAITKHFEESLKKFHIQNKNVLASQNGLSSEKGSSTSKEAVSISSEMELDIKPDQSISPTDKQETSESSEIKVEEASTSESGVTIKKASVPSGGQYDVESINSILKTFQHNCFINSSILNPEIKPQKKNEEIKVEDIKLEQLKVGEDKKSSPLQGNGEVTKIQQCEPILIDKGNLQNEVKLESSLPEVDIEAELPCTSIQLKKKCPRKRKPKEVKEENELEIAARTLKPCSKRSTKRKTNYREASSDEEPKFIASSRRRPNNKAAKTDIKKVSEESGIISNLNPAIKAELIENIMNTELISDSKVPIAIGSEEVLVAKELEVKTELQQEIKMENGVAIQNISPPESSTTIANSSETTIQPVKSETQTEVNTPPVNGEPTDDIKKENEESPKPKRKIVRNPAAARKRKTKRLRFTSLAAATAAKNKTRAHPLTRSEQLMMNKFMETQEPFLQKIPCLKLSSKISKCRECRCASIRSDSVFCRFYDFRRLRYKDKGVLVVDGFSDPNKDPGPSDIETWMLGPPPKDIDLDISRFILMHVGDQFCRIWQDEQTAIAEHMSPDKTIAWKKVVKGVREICDVCEATLFNFHWTCSKCGFGVCLDCYRDRKNRKIKKTDRPAKGCDEYGWLLCAMRDPHEMAKLMLTQIIPGNALNFLAHRLHQACKLWKIPQKCGCPLSLNTQAEQFASSCVELADKTIRDTYLRHYSRECEIKYLNKIKVLNPEDPADCFAFAEAETQLMGEAQQAGTLSTILSTTLKHLKIKPSANAKPTIANHLQDDVTKEYNYLLTNKRTQKLLPQKVMTLRVSRVMFPGIAHDWLCNGKLLRLLDSRDPRNTLMFKEFWKRGQPIMVSELCKFLNIKLWHPEAFCADFGEKKNDLINCMTGNLVPNQPMKLFWEGFQCVSKRLLDASGQPMLLKLKDWPPGDDFAEILPTRFKDLMSALPLPEYTLRTGGLNIASRLPAIFVPPDLGPKMYNAYGSALHPDKGTTNLHLDISDAVNIMVYVGIPTDASAKEQIKAALMAIDSGGCDILTRQRVRQPGVMPGALWHIYSARDADKIRDLLNRVTIERGFRLEPDHDPIHDQNWYLDNELRERLYDDYGVEGYPIAQCLGDAVFIPAGAPHQVRNLHNCIKVAEDFVSPENIQHCFHLSQQFRKLSMSHTNHEDKLQIRNVIYHSIKDTTAYLTYLLNQIM
ncbi:lysine-specific demethylase 3B isoform X1 [Episyrphus balteatus]|uniref:lysine-specific demethylase 3B isoform X1 n=1 Tax=Episyrphus balteatus TaxID=286459 RepID=UPI0024856E11|nr:lysine-specific demethylase 3B isoform X1 [Episyrphus balteatus]